MSFKLPSSSQYLNKITASRGPLKQFANRQSPGKSVARPTAPKSLKSIPVGLSPISADKRLGERATMEAPHKQSEKSFRIRSGCKKSPNSRDAATKAVLTHSVANVKYPETTKWESLASTTADSEKKSLFIMKRAKKPTNNPKAKESSEYSCSQTSCSEIEEFTECNYFKYGSAVLDQNQRPMKFMIDSVKQLKALHNDRFVEQPIIPKIPSLKSGGRKPVLVLDLDETLVHCCNFDGLQASYQTMISYRSKHNGSTINAKMNLRPHARQFLEEASRHYDLVVYTASESDYATAVCHLLDPERKYIQHIYSREHCVKTEKGFRVKDLRFVVGNDTSKVVLLDNSAYCFAPQIHNGIPMLSFTYEENDSELLDVLIFLKLLKDQPDMTAYIKSYFKMSKIIQCSSKSDLESHLRSIGDLPQ